MKSQIRTWLASAAFDRIEDAAIKDDYVIGTLIRLTYDADPLICWRSIDAIGRCAQRLAGIRMECLKTYLRRLFWMMSDESGSIAWRAPEIIVEIIRADPHALADFIPMTVSLLDMEPEDLAEFLPGILYALGRIGEISPDSVMGSLRRILDAADHKDGEVCAMALSCLGRLSAFGLVSRYPGLWQDERKVTVYRCEQLAEITIRELVHELSRCSVHISSAILEPDL